MRAEAQQDGPAFEVVAIKPSSPDQVGQNWRSSQNRMTMQNITLRQLIKVAYNLRSDSQVVDAPEWVGKVHFDVAAKMDEQEFARVDKMGPLEQQKESQLLLQRLLVDRFGVHVSMATRPLPKYDLVLDGAAPKLEVSTAGGGSDLQVHNGHLMAKSAPMELLAGILSSMPEAGGRVVLDNTGLTGKYNFQLNWSPENGSTPDTTLPGLFTALKEQLGLRMQRAEGAVPVVVVEKVSQPEFD